MLIGRSEQNVTSATPLSLVTTKAVQGDFSLIAAFSVRRFLSSVTSVSQPVCVFTRICRAVIGFSCMQRGPRRRVQRV